MFCGHMYFSKYEALHPLLYPQIGQVKIGMVRRLKQGNSSHLLTLTFLSQTLDRQQIQRYQTTCQFKTWLYKKTGEKKQHQRSQTHWYHHQKSQQQHQRWKRWNRRTSWKKKTLKDWQLQGKVLQKEEEEYAIYIAGLSKEEESETDTDESPYFF